MNPEPFRLGFKSMIPRAALWLWAGLWAIAAISGDWRMLVGDRMDVLLNTKTGEVRGLSVNRVSIPPQNEPWSGLFTDGASIWCVEKDCVVDLVSGEQMALPAASLLPLHTRRDAADVICRDRHLQVPYTEGLRYFDLGLHTFTDIPYRFDVEQHQGLSLRMPVLVSGRDRVFAVRETGVMQYTSGKWETCLIPEAEPVLDVRLVTGDRWLSLVISKMKPGDLDSFSIRTVCINRINGQVVLDIVNPGILKQAYADGPGRPVVEYINASIIAALFQRDQLRYRTIDPEDGSVKDRSIDVDEKRRHVYPVLDGRGNLILVVHSRDGNVSRLNTRTGKLRRLAEEVPYDYKVARTGSTLQILDNAMGPVGSIDLAGSR